ncbi:hypothetical protein FE697_003250 [Mumia zhuanghuii]|uniref:Secreted protein n=2 Tax=Mumia TaxID=1546255 RepID=A0ABW1QNK4_9ACTN|nr:MULTISPECIES: hypothetical protein [Mumia]KAA1424931.1 hypothetical protein FE697_003250 [Mumia zhuanghuii]
MGHLRTAWAAAPLALLVACGSAADEGSVQACTMIGAPAGINVTVEPPLASGADTVRVRVCWDGSCVDRESALLPGQQTVDEGCGGDDPDDTCSASATPDGTMQGFVDVADLPTQEVEVTTTVLGRGTEIHDAFARVVPEPTYPNGEDCDPGGNQASVTVP